jgi:excisionase family DNA binding protein
MLREMVRDVVRQEIRAALVDSTLCEGRRNGSTDVYLSIAKAARVADVAPGTLRRWIRSGRLPVRRAGRVYRIGRGELEAFLGQKDRDRRLVEKASEIVGAG